MSDEPKKPDYSCQYIDKIISIENGMVKALESNHYDDFDTLIGNVEDALWYRGDIETEAEKVSEINDDLRKWGEWQQERADVLDEEVKLLQAELEKYKESEAMRIRELEEAVRLSFEALTNGDKGSAVQRLRIVMEKPMKMKLMEENK